MLGIAASVQCQLCLSRGHTVCSRTLGWPDHAFLNDPISRKNK